MFAGTSKGKLLRWSAFFAFMVFACWQVDTLVTRSLALIFLVVVVVMINAVRRKISRDGTYRRLGSMPAEPQLSLDDSPTSPESSYFGPAQALDK